MQGDDIWLEAKNLAVKGMRNSYLNNMDPSKFSNALDKSHID
jgi:hypothetical protein